VRLLATILSLSIFACQTNKIDKKQIVQQVDPCSNLKDTIFNTISVFTFPDSNNSQKEFYDAINFTESKGSIKASRKSGMINIDKSKDVRLPHYIDTCNHKYWTQNFILKNIISFSCFFKSEIPLKGTKDYYPRFQLTQWSFANNKERDSVFKIMSWVYGNGGTEYAYRFNQTIVADKRLYLIETNAIIFEKTVIEYSKYLNTYVLDKESHSR
jgi:hypothetical protein